MGFTAVSYTHLDVYKRQGLRPVIFKLEATDEEAEIDYTPVR